jgi:hypothetical protein
MVVLLGFNFVIVLLKLSRSVSKEVLINSKTFPKSGNKPYKIRFSY